MGMAREFKKKTQLMIPLKTLVPNPWVATQSWVAKVFGWIASLKLTKKKFNRSNTLILISLHVFIQKLTFQYKKNRSLSGGLRPPIFYVLLDSIATFFSKFFKVFYSI